LVNAAVDKALNDIEDLLHSVAYKVFRKGLPRSDLEQAVAECRAHLWSYALPRFDASRQAQVSTFCYQCAFLFFLQYRRRIRRTEKSSRRIRLAPGDGMQYLTSLTTASRVEDHHIERLADDILAQPEKYFTKAQCVVLRAIITNPHKSKKQIATELGYRRASSLSMMLRRIKDQITAMSIFDATEGVGPCQRDL